MQRPCFVTDLLSRRRPAFCCLSLWAHIACCCCQVPSASHVSNQNYFIHSPVSTANVHPFAIPGSVRPVFDSKDYQRSFLGSARISQQILIVKYLRPVTPLCSSRYSESLRVIVRYTASCPMLFANLNVVSSCIHLIILTINKSHSALFKENNDTAFVFQASDSCTPTALHHRALCRIIVSKIGFLSASDAYSSLVPGFPTR